MKDDLNAISTIKQTNDLYIITLNNKGDYNKLYSSFPHFYLTNKIKNICKNENEKNYIYVNEAPNPVDVKWRNLEFNKENEFWYNKWKIIYKYVLFILVSFTLNIIGELLANKISKRKLIMQYIVNIIFAIFQEILNDWFSDIIKSTLEKNSNYLSYSDVNYYYIFFKAIFNFINQGVFPYCTYIIFSSDDDYSDLVSKMFVIIEMNGYGYPLIDFLASYGGHKKWNDMKELV